MLDPVNPTGLLAPTAHSGHALRRQAEAIARKNSVVLAENLSAMSIEAVQQLLHELCVHQIELEMQNEELRRTQLELDSSHARYFDFYDMAPVGYCTVSPSGLFLQANLTAGAMLGVDRDTLVNQPITRFIHQEDQDIYYLMRQQLGLGARAPQSLELRMLKGGTFFWVYLMAIAAQDETGAPVLRMVLTNISERKQIEAEIHRLAYYDPLTRLPNRRLLYDRLGRALAATGRSGLYGAIFFIDLDSFKALNDTRGHDVGDLLLSK